MTPKYGAEAGGFTLLELLLVLALLGTAATLLLPNLGGLGSRQFDAQVRELQDLLNTARRMAVVQGVDASVALLQAPDTTDTLLVGLWQPQDLSLRHAPAAGSLGSDRAQPVDEGLLMTFFPEGGSSGGRLWLSSAEGREVVLQIDAVTGRVSREEAR